MEAGDVLMMHIADAPYIERAMRNGNNTMLSDREYFSEQYIEPVQPPDCFECKACDVTDAGCVCREGHVLVADYKFRRNEEYLWCGGAYFEEEYP